MYFKKVGCQECTLPFGIDTVEGDLVSQST